MYTKFTLQLMPFSLIAIALWSSLVRSGEVYNNLDMIKSLNTTVSPLAQYLVYPANEAQTIRLQHAIEEFFDPRAVQVIRNYRSAVQFWLIVMTYPQHAEFTKLYPDVCRA